MTNRKNKKDLLNEKSLLRSKLKAIDLEINRKEDAGEDASDAQSEFDKLRAKIDQLENAIRRSEDIGDDDQDSEDKDDDSDGDEDIDADKAFAPTRKHVRINRGALPPIRKGNALGVLAVGSYYAQKNFSIRAGQDIISKTWSGSESIIKGLNTSQPIIPQAFITDFIELLQAETVVRKIGSVIQMPMGQMTIPRQNLGSTGAWMTEGTDIATTQAGFDTINMTWKKYGALTYTTKELLEFSPIDAAGAITKDLISRLALLEDKSFLLGTGVGGIPLKGIVSQVNQTTNVITSTVNANSTVDFQTISYDLQNAELALSANLVPGPYSWIMHPRTVGFLKQVSSSFGVFPFRDELNQNKLNGHPVYESVLLPTNNADAKGNATVSQILLVKGDGLIIGESYQHAIQMTDTGSFVDNGTQVNTFGRDLVAYKMTNSVDFAMRHDVSAAVLNADGWSIGNEGSKFSYDAPASGLSGSTASAARARSQ